MSSGNTDVKNGSGKAKIGYKVCMQACFFSANGRVCGETETFVRALASEACG